MNVCPVRGGKTNRNRSVVPPSATNRVGRRSRTLVAGAATNREPLGDDAQKPCDALRPDPCQTSSRSAARSMRANERWHDLGGEPPDALRGGLCTVKQEVVDADCT